MPVSWSTLTAISLVALAVWAELNLIRAMLREEHEGHPPAPQSLSPRRRLTTSSSLLPAAEPSRSTAST